MALRLSPMTQDEVAQLSHGEITTPAILNRRTQMPEEGGSLFATDIRSCPNVPMPVQTVFRSTIRRKSVREVRGRDRASQTTVETDGTYRVAGSCHQSARSETNSTRSQRARDCSHARSARPLRFSAKLTTCTEVLLSKEAQRKKTNGSR